MKNRKKNELPVSHRIPLEEINLKVTFLTVDEHQPFPKAYLPLIASCRDLDKF